jgi:hypothetical protein
MLFLATTLLLNDAHADVRRFALLVANNEGANDSEQLYFAEQDAEKVRDALLDVGGYEPGRVSMLLGDDRGDLLSEFGDLRRRIDRAHEAGDEVVFLFYYSGHADDDGLQMADTRVAFDELELMLAKSGADVRLAFIDACDSGQLTRRKGGTLAPSFVFDVSERLGAEGTVIITSSADDEASQESDEIGGSYFTHYLVSGMRGAADENADQLVTLAEVYEYVYEETVLKTAQSSLGTQHPTYEWDLSGEGDIVLTDLQPATSALVFPAGVGGTYSVFDVGRRTFVGEVTGNGHDTRLALKPGHYLVQVRHPTFLQVADVRLTPGQSIETTALTFRAVEYDEDTAKGLVEKRVKEAKRPDSSVRVLAGGTAPANPQIAAAYYGTVPVIGLGYRREWHNGQWLGFDLMGGAGPNVANVGLPSAVPTYVGYGTSAVSVGYQWDYRAFQAGAGLRGGVVSVTRSFADESVAPTQTLFTPAAGGMWFAGFHTGRFVAELEWHSTLVPFALSDTQKSYLERDVILSVGMAW